MSEPAFGPLLSFAACHSASGRRCGRAAACDGSRVAAGGARWGLMLGRSALCADSTAMLGPGSRRITRCVRCAHCARTDAASQLTKRAARADPGPALLVAPEIAPTGHRLPRATRVGLRTERHSHLRKGVPGQVRSGECVAVHRWQAARFFRQARLSGWMQGGGGACGRRPHSRSPRGLHAERVLMPPLHRALRWSTAWWAGERRHRRRPAATAARGAIAGSK